ncbi:MAG TPA: hypothetical protein VF032_05840 [Thermoleophilaceae bacterium]
MRKELRPVHDAVSCDVCGRTILKGERTEAYLAPAGHRKLVCELCIPRADHEGWIRESAAGDMPATRPREQRRPLFGRLRRERREDMPVAEADYEPPPIQNGEHPQHEPTTEEHEAAEPRAPKIRRQSRRKDPRHVRAVPTNTQVKIERALEMFNHSEHTRTIAGIARTLGHPWVSALPRPEAPSEVDITVAWELSWYRYRIDLGDASDPVTLLDKGQEMDELGEEQREWNASATEDGQLAAGVVSAEQ